MTQTLRELARAYADGITPLDEYRKNRYALINGILDGSIELEEIEYLPIFEPKDNTRTEEDLTYDEDRDEAKTEIRSVKKKQPQPSTEEKNNTSDPSSPSTTGKTTNVKSIETGPTTPIDSFRIKPLEKKKSNINLFIGIGIAVLIAIAIGIFFITKSNPKEVVEEEIQEQELVPQTPGKVGSELIREFVTNKRWNDNSMNSFLQQWTELSDTEKRATLASGTATQMTNAIFQQFKQEEALASIGDAELAKQKQQKLINFANRLGINDERLVISNPTE